MFKNVIPDERVLDPLETQAYPTLTRLSQQFEEGRLGPTPTVPASDIDAMTRSSTPEWPTEFRLTSGRLEFDEDGLVRIVDGRIEAESNLLTAGRKT
jgi:hypothetical protein